MKASGPSDTLRTAATLWLCLVAFVGLLVDNASAQMVAIDPAQAKFTTLDAAPGCIQIATLRGDMTKGPSVMLQRMTAGCTVPWHWHTPAEQVMVASGNFLMKTRDGATIRLRTGGYILMPGHHVHEGSCAGPGPCLLFGTANGVFDIHYVDAAGNQIPVAVALHGREKSDQR